MRIYPVIASIEPYFVVAVRPPSGIRRRRDLNTGEDIVDEVFRRDRRDDLGFVHTPEEVFYELRPLEPPMPEELGIKGGDDDRLNTRELVV